MTRLWEATVMRVAGTLTLGYLTFWALEHSVWWFAFLAGLGVFLLAGTEVTKGGKTVSK